MQRADRIIRNILFYTPVVLSSVIAVLSLVFVAALYAEIKGKTISINVSGDANGEESAGYSNDHIDYGDPLLKQRKIVITSDVNRRMSHAIISKLLYLNAQRKAPIDLYLRTNGGKYSDAFAIADGFRLIQAPVNIHILGSCQSAGLIILLGATGKRSAATDAIFMAHRTFDADDVSTPLTEAYVDSRRVESALNAKARLPKEWFPLTGSEQFFFDAKDALKYGLIEKIEP